MEGDYLHNRFMFLCVAERHQQTQTEIEVPSINWHCRVERIWKTHPHTHLQRNMHIIVVWSIIVDRITELELELESPDSEHFSVPQKDAQGQI